MRFLLHPRCLPAKLALRPSNNGVANAVRQGRLPTSVVTQHGDTTSHQAKRVEKEPVDALSPSLLPSSTTATSGSRRAWGQQCSVNCGCVVRFEASIRHDSLIESVSYVAKQVLTTRTLTSPAKAAKSVAETDASSGHLEPLLTTKGRPMFQECRCETVHSLSSLIVEELNRTRLPWSTAKNWLEFSSTRSSDSFRTTVLQTHGLPRTHTHCFDVVEEALTALLKGHLPRPRKAATPFAAKNLRLLDVDGNVNERHWHDDRDYASYGLSFRLWKDQEENYQVIQPRSLSSLNLLDLTSNGTIHTDRSSSSRRRAGKSASPPQDWVSYVDELYEEDDESA